MNKIGIISDIHSNIFAFELLKKELDKENISEYIFLGDYITDGYNSNNILNYIKNKSENIILGNREMNVLNITEQNNTHRWFPTMCAYNEITSENIDFLKSLPVEKIIKITNKKIYMCHTDPYDSKNIVNFEDEKFLRKLILDKKCDIYFFGHTHSHKLKKYDNKLFINPGAISCSVNTPCAFTYGVLSISDNDNINYKQEIIKFDKNEYINQMVNSKYYKKEPVWASLLINTTVTGIDYYSKFVEYFLSKKYSDTEIEKKWLDLYFAFCEQEKIPNYIVNDKK